MKARLHDWLWWSAFALFAALAIGVEVAPTLASGHSSHVAPVRACEPAGMAIERASRLAAECECNGSSARWLVRPIEIASAVGPLMIF